MRWEIQSLGQRLAKAAGAEELARRAGSSAKSRAQNDEEIKLIIRDIRKLLDRIEDAVPLINLAITTSGASLSTSLPATVSPSRLLQASTFLTAGDTGYSIEPTQAVQVGPTFTLSIYMLFAGHVRPQDEEGIRATTWKEVIRKAKVKLRRVPMNMALELSLDDTSPLKNGTPSKSSPGPANADYFETHLPGEARADEFAYQLMMIEDLDDDRIHTFEDGQPEPGSFEDVDKAGIRDIVPIHEISKVFYADTGKILNIGSEGESNNPVLLLKRDLNATPPRRMMDRESFSCGDLTHESNDYDETDAKQEAQSLERSTGPTRPAESNSNHSWQLPAGLDPEWIAFEVYTEAADDSDSESEHEKASPRPHVSREPSLDPHLAASMSHLHLYSPRSSAHSSPAAQTHLQTQPSPSPMITSFSTLTNPMFNNIRTSLSLLEVLLRLTSLQQFQQQSHLSITDELLNFFLEESSTTGAGGDEYHRQRVRAEARRKVGWDPYDESPVKRRGEEYQYRNGGNSPPWDNLEVYGFPSLRSENGFSPGGEENRGFPSIRAREHTPDTPPYPMSARGNTPAGQNGDSTSPSPAMPKGRRAFLSRQTDQASKGSPLARPQTAQTDEGLGTSPASQGAVVVTEQEKRRRQ